MLTVEEFLRQIQPSVMAQLRARLKAELELIEHIDFRDPASTFAEGLPAVMLTDAPKPTYAISPFTQTLILCPETGAVYDRHEAQERLLWLIGQATNPTIGDALAEAYVRQIGDLVRAMRQLKEEE